MTTLQKPSFPRAASATHLPLDKQFHEAAVAAANATAAKEPARINATDDEIIQIPLIKENPPKKTNEKVEFGLPARGAFIDSHDGQRQDAYGDRKASISTQDDFAIADILKRTFTGGNTLSFEPTTTPSDSIAASPGDQPAVKTVPNEQSQSMSF